MHYVYILKSLKTGKFYIGETPDVKTRVIFHNEIEKNTNSTKSGIPWEVFWSLIVSDRTLARKIELHIKRMKNKKYYEDLKKYPEISDKLILKIFKLLTFSIYNSFLALPIIIGRLEHMTVNHGVPGSSPGEGATPK